MKTITIHISEETARCLEADSGRLRKTDMYLNGILLQLRAQHPEDCQVENCQTAVAIEETVTSLEIVGRVQRFQHDVLAAYRLAPVEVE